MEEELEAIALEDGTPLDHVGEEAPPPEEIGRSPEEADEEGDA